MESNDSKFQLKSFALGVISVLFLTSPQRMIEFTVSEWIPTYRNVRQSFKEPEPVQLGDYMPEGADEPFSLPPRKKSKE